MDSILKPALTVVLALMVAVDKNVRGLVNRGKVFLYQSQWFTNEYLPVLNVLEEKVFYDVGTRFMMDLASLATISSLQC